MTEAEYAARLLRPHSFQSKAAAVLRNSSSGDLAGVAPNAPATSKAAVVPHRSCGEPVGVARNCPDHPQAAASSPSSPAAGQAGAPVVERSGAPAPNSGAASRAPPVRSGGGDPTVTRDFHGAGTPILGKPRRPAIYGYDYYDVEDALKGIENALPFALAAFKCHLENNEHVYSFVDWDGFADRLIDMVADELRAPLMKRLHEMEGNR